MLQNHVISATDLREELEPYLEVLEPCGIDGSRVIGYAIRAIHNNGDYVSCRHRIEEDLNAWPLNNAVPDRRVFIDRLTHTCLDAVGDALTILTPQLTHLFGFIPHSLALRGFAGIDPVVSIVTEDDPHENQHRDAQSPGRQNSPATPLPAAAQWY